MKVLKVRKSLSEREKRVLTQLVVAGSRALYVARKRLACFLAILSLNLNLNLQSAVSFTPKMFFGLSGSREV